MNAFWFFNGKEPVKQKYFVTYLVLFWINSSPEERRFPAVHIILSITCQFYLAKILVHVPVEINKWLCVASLQYTNSCTHKEKIGLQEYRSTSTGFIINTTDLCSVLKIAKMCFVDIKPFSTSLSFRLSKGSIYFFSFS